MIVVLKGTSAVFPHDGRPLETFEMQVVLFSERCDSSSVLPSAKSPTN